MFSANGNTRISIIVFMIALFSFTLRADAGLVLTDFDPDIVLDDTNGSSGFAGNWNVEIDADNDVGSTVDFRIMNRQYTEFLATQYENRLVLLHGDAYISTNNLSLGAVVDASTSFSQTTRVITTFGGIGGEHYWGLRVDDGMGGSRYGYIRLVSPDNEVQNTLTVDLFAFSDMVGQSVVVGAVSSVPEPVSAVTFSIACVVLLARRRV